MSLQIATMFHPAKSNRNSIDLMDSEGHFSVWRRASRSTYSNLEHTFGCYFCLFQPCNRQRRSSDPCKWWLHETIPWVAGFLPEPRLSSTDFIGSCKSKFYYWTDPICSDLQTESSHPCELMPYGSSICLDNLVISTWVTTNEIPIAVASSWDSRNPP